MPRKINYIPIIGVKIHNFIPLEFYNENKGRKTGKFQCLCGKIKDYKISTIYTGKVKSCKSCSLKIKIEPRQKFNRLTFIDYFETKNNKWYGSFECECDITKIHIKQISLVVSEHTKSCGCLIKENGVKLGKSGKTHGMSKTPIHKYWSYLIDRKELEGDWLQFENFYNDIGYSITKGQCIIKKFNDQPYSLSNVELVSTKEASLIKGQATCLERYGVKSLLELPENQKISKKENELRDYLNNLGFNFNKTRKIISKELDMYDSNINLAIEYCGLYWHNELSPDPKLKNYHYNKYKECLDKNIQLITIFEDEYKTRKNQVLNRLKSLLGLNQKIYARKCEIKIVNNKEAQEFVNQYHIQTLRVQALFSYGLYYNEELYGVLTINKHHRDNSRYVINRFCSKEDINIVGGFSKLISFIKKEGKFTELITWSDNRWSNGNLYAKCGFILEKELKPDYSYVNMKVGRKRLSKQTVIKKALKIPNDISESQFMENNDYGHIWDCGKKRWILKFN